MVPIDGRTPFEILAARIGPQRADEQHLLPISAHLEDHTAHDVHASLLLAGSEADAVIRDRKA